MNRNAHGTITDPKDVCPGQYRWDPLDYEDSGVTTHDAAKQALSDRTKLMNQIRKHRPDLECKGWTLRGQLRQWESFMVPDGRVRNVYYLNVVKKGEL